MATPSGANHSSSLQPEYSAPVSTSHTGVALTLLGRASLVSRSFWSVPPGSWDTSYRSQVVWGRLRPVFSNGSAVL